MKTETENEAPCPHQADIERELESRLGGTWSSDGNPAYPVYTCTDGRSVNRAGWIITVEGNMVLNYEVLTSATP